MSRYIPVNKKAFTLVEALTVTVIALYIFAGAWAVFIMAWRWAHEISPRTEAQRMARKIITVVTDGSANLKDTSDVTRGTSGSYTIGGVTYWQRNGLSWATNVDTASLPARLDGVNGATAVNFALSPDASGNPRMFYLETDADAGTYTVYYQDADSRLYEIARVREPWRIDLRFWRHYESSTSTTYDNVIDVAVTVETEVTGTRNEVYPVVIEYQDTINLGNIVEA